MVITGSSKSNPLTAPMHYIKLGKNHAALGNSNQIL